LVKGENLMALLHIYDSSDSGIVKTANQRTADKKLPIPHMSDLRYFLDQLKKENVVYDRILFETHGNPGKILFKHMEVDEMYWQDMPRRYDQLTAPFAKIYFNGCNVAEGEAGWRFLEAVARVFMSATNGEIFGHTTMGFGNPFGSHTFHLGGGDTKTVYVKGGIVGRSKDDTWPNP
jgi:hypothetical protein